MLPTALTDTWQRLAQRLNARTPRERVILCCAALVIGYALADQFLLAKQIHQLRDASRQNTLLEQEIKQLQLQEKTLRMLLQADPNTPLLLQQKAYREEIGKLDQRIAAVDSTLIQSGQIIVLLKDLLKSHSKLTITGLRLLPPEALSDSVGNAAPATGKSTPDNSPNATHPPALLWRHNIEITLRGNYLDILGYVEDLERLPWRFSWSKLNIASQAAGPTSATITLGTYSINQTLIKL
jgi:MSHA biogenesis protein MshJ